MRFIWLTVSLIFVSELLFAQEVYHFTVDCNVHTMPNATSEVIAKAKADQSVTYLKTMESGDWAKVKFNNKIGYVAIGNIAAGEFKAKIKKATVEKYHVSIFQTHMYAKPNASSTKLETYNKNDMVDVISAEGEWYKIQDGMTVGYILASHLTKGEPKLEEEKVTVIKSYEVTKATVNVYSKPNANSKVLVKHYKGDVIEVVGKTKDGNWARVQLATGFAYIPFDAVIEIEQTASSGGSGGGKGVDIDKIGTSKNPKKVGAVCRDGVSVSGDKYDVCAKHNGVQFWIYSKE